MAISYKDSGVDVERGYEAVRLMKQHVQIGRASCRERV